MSTITGSLAVEDLAFLQRFSEAQGTSAGEFLARQARNLRQQLEKPLPPEIVAASGIIAGDVDAKTDLLESRPPAAANRSRATLKSPTCWPGKSAARWKSQSHEKGAKEKISGSQQGFETLTCGRLGTPPCIAA
jgi:hypothetical protein